MGPALASLSVVVPVYNGSGTLSELVERLEPVLAAAAGSFELLLVDDGSGDDSWETICSLAADRSWVSGISLSRNYGQHNALLAGIRRARHDWIVTLDDDLQHPPEEIPKLLAGLREGADVVYGAPQREQHGRARDLASRIAKLALQRAMGAEIAGQVSAFRAFRASLRDAFADYQSPFVSVDVLLTWATTRFVAVTVRHEPREVGASNYTFRTLVVHALNMMTGFSVVPLQFATLVGFGFTLLGILILAYVLLRALLEGGAAPGFPFLASLIAIFSGAQLFALGIIGEYLARMHVRSMGRPSYTIREHSEPGATR